MKQTIHYSKVIKQLTYPRKGFTLIEIMITIAIAGIIAAIALPSLNTLLVDMRVENQLSETHRLLLTARNSSINTGLSTTVCPLDSDKNCTNDWEGKISVFTNVKATGTVTTFDDDDVLIKVKEAADGDKFQLSTAGAIIYTPTGRTLSGSSNQLIYCPKNYTEKSNGIDVSSSGRANIGTKNLSGIYEDIDGDPFTCS